MGAPHEDPSTGSGAESAAPPVVRPPWQKFDVLVQRSLIDGHGVVLHVESIAPEC